MLVEIVIIAIILLFDLSYMGWQQGILQGGTLHIYFDLLDQH